uniref:Uncharacterized protein n=1 Tax=Arundo donax TaxID=35708 RepID=A0A0A9FNX8_ARUDO
MTSKTSSTNFSTLVLLLGLSTLLCDFSTPLL